MGVPRLLGLYWVVTLAAACRQIVDFDASEPPPAQLDLGPFQRFLSGTECDRCLEEKCSEPLRTCDADEFCSAWFKDARASELPVIANRDLQLRLSDASWELDHDRPSGAEAQFELDDCSIRLCGEECRRGRDFGCVGRFDWPESFSKETNLRLRMSDLAGPAITDLHVKACPAGTDCVRVLGEGVTDAGGFATLKVETEAASLTPTSEFYGFLRFDETEEYASVDFLRSDPWLDRAYNSFFWVTVADSESISSRAGLTRDASRGSIFVQVYDCTGAGAFGVSLDFWTRNQSGFVPCESCEISYPGEGGYPDVTLQEFQFPGTSLAVGHALGAVAVVARDTKTRRPFALQRTGYFAAGHNHSVGLTPASRREVEGMPPAIR